MDEECVYDEIDRIIRIIDGSESRDSLSESLCQCVVGYLLKYPNKKEILLYMLNRIFMVSFRTARDVISWVIYSDDERKMNIDLVIGFIRYNLINIIEYDQYLSRKVGNDKYFKFILNLLNKTVLGDVKICTPYDFVFTIESLSKMNNERYDDRIYEVLKGVSEMMLPMDSHDDKVSGKIREGLSAAWDSFIRYYRIPSSYCYHKIDSLCMDLGTIDDVLCAIKTYSGLFITSIERKSYLYQKIYLRFLINILREIKQICSNREGKELIFQILRVVSPRNVPSFTFSFMELCVEDYVLDSFFDSKEGLYLCKEILCALNMDDSLLFITTKFFMEIRNKKPYFFKRYSFYFSMLCNNKYVYLKNILNEHRECNLQRELSFSCYRECYISIYSYLKGDINDKFIDRVKELGKKERRYVIYSLVDNLGSKNRVSVNGMNIIKMFVRREMLVDEIREICFGRYLAGNYPVFVGTVCDEVFGMGMDEK
jgi:CCR4-NOT transcription complex subunit 1